jgi:hypothetical protein
LPTQDVAPLTPEETVRRAKLYGAVVLEEALSALRDDSHKLSACRILVHNVYERLCKALHIDSDKIVVRQYRVHEDVAQ